VHTEHGYFPYEHKKLRIAIQFVVFWAVTLTNVVGI